MTRPNTPERFWTMAKREGPCLIWQGRVHHRGYPRWSLVGKGWLVHRLAWTLARGPIPEGLFVCHTCDRKTCVEPLHLFLGTSPDNTRDHVAKGRAHLNGRSGPLNSQARLTTEQVAEIRALASARTMTHRAIAARFGIASKSVGEIVSGRRRALG